MKNLELLYLGSVCWSVSGSVGQKSQKLSKIAKIYGREEEIDALKNYKEFEEKFWSDRQDFLQCLKNGNRVGLYNKLILAFKLNVCCNLGKTEHKLMFRESKSKEKDGTIYENTKEAIKMLYNVGSLTLSHVA